MMKKIALTLMVVGVLSSTFASLSMAEDQAAQDKDLTCMAAAVDKREMSIQTGLDTYYNTVKPALIARQGSLKTAWAITEKKQRKEAIKAAWKAFKGTWRTSNKQLKKDRNAAWAQFRVDRSACGPSVSDDEPKQEN